MENYNVETMETAAEKITKVPSGSKKATIIGFVVTMVAAGAAIIGGNIVGKRRSAKKAEAEPSEEVTAESVEETEVEVEE